jgi:release factor glutamine methyltransferase
MSVISETYYRYVYKPAITMYLKTDSGTRIDGFKLKIFKGVFHPKFFFSSKYFYEFLSNKTLAGKAFLEIGCGSGILSLLALRKGAAVTAVDVDPKAVENTNLNFQRNFNSRQTGFKVLQSDVFSGLQAEVFDMIVINPPYYFRKVDVDAQLAWYCGENGEYFEKLFSGLRQHVHDSTQIYMILAENAEISRIKEMATLHGIGFVTVDQRKIRFETSYIFQLKPIA